MTNNAIVAWDNEKERQHRDRESQRKHERWMTESNMMDNEKQRKHEKMLSIIEYAKTRCQKLGTEEACSPLQ